MPVQPTLKTARLVLRPFTPQDAARVQQLAGAPEVASTTLNIPHPYADGAAEAWIAGRAAAWEHGETAVFAITTAADGVVGAIGLRLEPAHRRAELGFWIGVPYWGRGYATEAAQALITFGFTTLALNRIYACHFPRNPASGRVLHKAGMRPEGVLRQHVIKNGRGEDLVSYAILAADHPPG